MKPEQPALDLPPWPRLARADFLASDCNAAALGWIERWPDWPALHLVLYGPPGCGKSHLARLWEQRAGAVAIGGDTLAETAAEPPGGAVLPAALAIDDAERAPEEAVLHLFNRCAEAGASLLLVARQAPAAWPIALPSLASRLRAAPAVGIAPPDDGLLAAILLKHFADRQIKVSPAVIGYLVPRMERSFAAAAALAGCVDRLHLGSRKKHIGLGIARRALAELA